MRDHGAIVSPAVDLARLRRQWAELDAREEKALAEIRLARGRLLVEARKAFPARGPKAAGWGALLAEWKVEERTARRYMALAGYVEVSDNLSETSEPDAREKRGVPTYAEAGIVKPPKASAPVRVTREVVDEDPPDDVPVVDDGDPSPFDDDPPAPPPRGLVCGTCEAPIAGHLVHCPGCEEHVPGTSPTCSSCGGDLAGAKSAHPPVADAPRDSVGRVIPEALRSLFEIAPARLRRLHGLLSEVAREREALIEALRAEVLAGRMGGDALGELLYAVPTDQELREAASKFLRAVPHALCAYCKATNPKCTGCKGGGWHRREIYEHVAEKVRTNDEPVEHHALGMVP